MFTCLSDYTTRAASCIHTPEWKVLSSSLLARSKNERRPSVKDQHTILFWSDRRLKSGWLFAAVSAFLRAPFRYRIAWEVQFLLWKWKRKFCSSSGWSGLNVTKEKYRLTCGAVQHWETSDSKSSVTSRDIVELCNRTRGEKINCIFFWEV